MYGIVPVNRRRGQLAGREDNFDRMFDNFFSDLAFPVYFGHNDLMRVDIREEENAYLLDAELPGVDKENIDIETEDNCLAISVNKEDQYEARKENFIRHERRSSSVSRSFNLEGVDIDKISAKLENGVLTIRLPKMEQDIKRQSRKVSIG
jgi:HSP20 family protein